MICPICNVGPSPGDEETYPNSVCRSCDDRAVNADGREPHHSTSGDFGDNPVFIDSRKCWRRYKFGGYITMLDPDDCESEEQFYRRRLPHFAAYHMGFEWLVEQYNRSVEEGDAPDEPSKC